MNKSMATRSISTAPVSPRGNARILAEARAFESRLLKRRSRLQNEVGDAWAEAKASPTIGGKAAASVKRAFKEIQLDAESPDLELGLYLCSKLKMAGEAGIFNPALDIELLALRQIMRSL